MKIFSSPDGKAFKERAHLEKYLAKNPSPGITVDDFNFTQKGVDIEIVDTSKTDSNPTVKSKPPPMILLPPPGVL